MKWPWNTYDHLSVDEQIKIRRSRVRTMVTHGAAWFLFGGAMLLIAYLMIRGGTEGRQQGVDLFQTVLPVAASIIAFWFGRQNQNT
ncbi:hypothetical protein [Candidatus Palauibacter sp.]|uniref:hypothetical protein n=1 Tax=Candidatus Palauibacter sp. TaxID=3101350 RepID=UPI003B5B995E